MSRMSRDMATAVAYARLGQKAMRAGNYAAAENYAKLEGHYRGRDARAKERAEQAKQESGRWGR